MEISKEKGKGKVESADNAAWPVEIIRSGRRVKTVSARLVNGVLQVQAPAHISDAELGPIIEKLRTRMSHRVPDRPDSDHALEQRAHELNRQFFGGQLRWKSVRYSTRQNTMHGSCTPTRGTIRLSSRMATLPAWVRDYVLVHELAHLLEANHGPNFWALVNRYPLTERARGYLMALDLENIGEG
jgi:hypothetical protein